MGVRLQPLRVPHGWLICWNTLFEEDPTDPANAAGYYFGGVNLFQATHASRRRAIDIEWRTEDGQPTVGRYRMVLLPMTEPEQSSPPRRVSVRKLVVQWDTPVGEFETTSRLDMVAELEAWLAGEGGRR